MVRFSFGKLEITKLDKSRSTYSEVINCLISPKFQVFVENFEALCTIWKSVLGSIEIIMKGNPLRVLANSYLWCVLKRVCFVCVCVVHDVVGIQVMRMCVSDVCQRDCLVCSTWKWNRFGITETFVCCLPKHCHACLLYVHGVAALPSCTDLLVKLSSSKAQRQRTVARSERQEFGVRSRYQYN